MLMANYMNRIWAWLLPVAIGLGCNGSSNNEKINTIYEFLLNQNQQLAARVDSLKQVNTQLQGDLKKSEEDTQRLRRTNDSLDIVLKRTNKWGTVYFTIVDASSGEPLQNAKVHLDSHERPWSVNKGGILTLEYLTGSVTGYVEAEGYKPFGFQLWDFKTSPRKFLKVELYKNK